MSLRCQVQVRFNNIPSQKAETVKRALEPDNVNFPENLSLQMRNTGDILIFDFQSKGDMKGLIGTIDEILEHIQVSLEVIK